MDLMFTCTELFFVPFRIRNAARATGKVVGVELARQPFDVKSMNRLIARRARNSPVALMPNRNVTHES